MLKHVGDKWYVLDSSGKKVLGKHPSKEKAVAQLNAIEISKKEREESNESKVLSFSNFLKEDFTSTLQYHEELNPTLWNGFELKDDVREKLIEIGNTWVTWANIPVEAVKDLILVGGNANYNYTPNSDVDLHILVDTDEIKNCPEFIDDYLKDKKQLWSLTHDIKIHGNDVEVYAQDMNDGFATDQGVYSLTQDKWLAEPVYQEISLNNPNILKKVQEYMEKIDSLISSNAEDESFEKLKQKFKDMRSESIKKYGEFSHGNLIFKELRNIGYLDKMNSYLKSKQDERLSL
jgi:hypothetical protein